MRKIDKFLDTYKKSTRNTYRSAVNKFIACIYGVEGKAELLNKADEYIEDTTRDYFEDIMKFALSLEKVPPKTALTYTSGIKEFLAFIGYDLSKKEIKAIKNRLPKGNRARTIESDMDKETIKQLLEHMDLKFSTLMLVLSSSGMRIGEALQIQLEDIDMIAVPTPITIRGEYTKNGNYRTTFISKEAKKSLVEWLKVRKKYLIASINKNNGLIADGHGIKKDINDDRVFPFSYDIVQKMWTNVLDKSELLKIDRGTGRTQLRIHQLRKYFRSQLAIGCPVDIVEALMGHEGYLTEAYRRYSGKQMAEEYLKHENLLYISTPKDLEKIESEFKGELSDNRRLLEQLILEKNDLTKKMELISDANEILKNEIENINAKYDDEAIEKLIFENECNKQLIIELTAVVTDLIEGK